MDINTDNFIILKTSSIELEYSLGKIKGEGGYARVCEATHKISGIRRAVKQISKKKIPNNNPEQVKEEIKILRYLDHPNIIQLHEIYESE